MSTPFGEPPAKHIKVLVGHDESHGTHECCREITMELIKAYIINYMWVSRSYVFLLCGNPFKKCIDSQPLEGSLRWAFAVHGCQKRRRSHLSPCQSPGHASLFWHNRQQWDLDTAGFEGRTNPHRGFVHLCHFMLCSSLLPHFWATFGALIQAGAAPLEHFCPLAEAFSSISKTYLINYLLN